MLFPAVIGAFLTSIYVLRVAGQIFWGAQSSDGHFQHLPDARGTEWAALGILVFALVLFGVAPRIAIDPVRTATVPLLERVQNANTRVSASARSATARPRRSSESEVEPRVAMSRTP